MNTELLDDNQRDFLAASIEYVDPPERTEPVTKPVVTEKPEPPKLNRAERRRLQRYITRKARRQIRKVERRQSREIRELRGKRCPRCNLLFIGRAQWRCQCKAVPARKEKAA